LAQRIAVCEGGADPRIAYIAGTLHDVLDSKLVSNHNAEVAESHLIDLLKSEQGFVSDNEITNILSIVHSVGYKNIIRDDWRPLDLSVEYRCVQDADLLDAIGAVGIARCFAYGGKKNRRMFGVTKAVRVESISHSEYLTARDSADESGVDHFFDKLLRIPDKMLTATGRRMAKDRLAYMVTYLRQLDVEMEESGDPDAGKITAALSQLVGQLI
jgi:uncharacterized protein